jgi:hypothetical protein
MKQEINLNTVMFCCVIKRNLEISSIVFEDVSQYPTCRNIGLLVSSILQGDFLYPVSAVAGRLTHVMPCGTTEVRGAEDCVTASDLE